MSRFGHFSAIESKCKDQKEPRCQISKSRQSTGLNFCIFGFSVVENGDIVKIRQNGELFGVCAFQGSIVTESSF